MGALIIAFFCGIVFSILCNELAKALGRKMANTERMLP
jgi:ABC-type polysaccharide transport system permease subunit